MNDRIRPNHAALAMQNIDQANETTDIDMKRLAIETAKVHALLQLGHSVRQFAEITRTKP